jgi:hypothetical protein
MKHPGELVWAACLFALACLSGWRSVRRLKSLQGEPRTIARDAMIASFSAAMSISLAGLSYVLWSGGKNQLLLALAFAGLALFVASVAWAVRLSLRWSEMVLQRK